MPPPARKRLFTREQESSHPVQSAGNLEPASSPVDVVDREEPRVLAQRQQEWESQEQRRSRLAAHMRMTRALDSTPSQLRHRRANARRMAAARASRTPRSGLRHRLANAERMAVTRSNQSPQSRETQRQIHARAMAATRANESAESRQRRLLDQSRSRAHQIQMRRHPSRMTNRECFKEPGSAYKYSPAIDYIHSPYLSIGKMDNLCQHCKALKFPGESKGLCCKDGKVSLPSLESPPPILQDLIQGDSELSKEFLSKIRLYNSAFCMTSFQANIIREQGFMPTFKVQGQVYHNIGSLFPNDNNIAKFLQIYFLAPEEQVNRRQGMFEGSPLERGTVTQLQNMLFEYNRLVRDFKNAIDNAPPQDYRVVIRSDKTPVGEHRGRYNAPDALEVAVILVGQQTERRDIILHPRQEGPLQRIQEIHKFYDALQYPLIFWQGEEGYNIDVQMVNPATGEEDPLRLDEVTRFQQGRYISSNEAAWRIFGFLIHQHYPPVQHLAVHLENGQRVYFRAQGPTREQLNNPKDTTLTAFFKLCETDDFAKTLLYAMVPSYYTFNSSQKKWKRRKIGEPLAGWPGVKEGVTIGRVYTVSPRHEECHCLRLLLHHVRGPTSFQFLKTVEDFTCSTYKEACRKLGLLEDDANWDETLREANLSSSGRQLRDLFAIMLCHCSLTNPLQLWQKHKKYFCEDLSYHHHVPDSPEPHPAILNQCLKLLQDKLLQLGGEKLERYGLPEPSTDSTPSLGLEVEYNLSDLQRHVDANLPRLFPEQRQVYDTIMESLQRRTGKIFFLDAPGGTGKTFLLNLLLAKVRSENMVAIAVASSGIAATLLSGGRTAHSTFKIPFDLTRSETPTCNISKETDRAKLLQAAKFIVWDEATMAHKLSIEAVNRTLRDLRGNEQIMGGAILLLAGDFRQTLPVVPRGTKADELDACLKASTLWHNITCLKLSTNIRVHQHGDEAEEVFAKKLLDIGDGNLPMHPELQIHQIGAGIVVSSLGELIEKVYPNLSDNYRQPDFLSQRAILAPKNDIVDKINMLLIDQIPTQAKTYLSIDSVIDLDEAIHYPVEFLNSINPPGMPSHKLTLKVGAPVILLRNLDPPKLCNGTRLVVKSLYRNVIECVIIAGNYVGDIVFVPRIPLLSSTTHVPFEFKRLQFPVRCCFAMSINKAQGQTMKIVGLQLQDHCFAHGQFYVGCSRVSSEQNLFILSKVNGYTRNIVYHEVLQ